MRTVNRSALVIRPKRRYVEWVNGLEPNTRVTLEEERGHPTIYRSVVGIVSRTGSPAAQEGADLVFVVCSVACGNGLRQALGKEGLEVLE